MDKVALDVVGAALSIAPFSLIYLWLRPMTALWVSVLLGLGSAVLAVCFFEMWRYLEHPVLAYLDAIVYGLLALLLPLVAINGWLMVNDEQRKPNGRAGLGLERGRKNRMRRELVPHDSQVGKRAEHFAAADRPREGRLVELVAKGATLREIVHTVSG